MRPRLTGGSRFVPDRLAVRRRPPDDRSGITTIPEAVLSEAIRDTILHLVHGSMRIHTTLEPDGVQSDLGFWGLAMMWELGYSAVAK